MQRSSGPPPFASAGVDFEGGDTDVLRFSAEVLADAPVFSLSIRGWRRPSTSARIRILYATERPGSSSYFLASDCARQAPGRTAGRLTSASRLASMAPALRQAGFRAPAGR